MLSSCPNPPTRARRQPLEVGLWQEASWCCFGKSTPETYQLEWKSTLALVSQCALVVHLISGNCDIQAVIMRHLFIQLFVPMLSSLILSSSLPSFYPATQCSHPVLQFSLPVLLQRFCNHLFMLYNHLFRPSHQIGLEASNHSSHPMILLSSNPLVHLDQLNIVRLHPSTDCASTDSKNATQQASCLPLLLSAISVSTSLTKTLFITTSSLFFGDQNLIVGHPHPSKEFPVKNKDIISAGGGGGCGMRGSCNVVVVFKQS